MTRALRWRDVRADFGFRTARVAGHRLFSPALGGGSILDVGAYPVSFARLIAGWRSACRSPNRWRSRAAVSSVLEAEYVAHRLPAIEAEWPAMSWADTLGNLRVMDAWNASLRTHAQL
jgi:hypothetical protein